MERLKQTGLGTIPEDWEVKTFNSLFEVPLRSGLTRPTSVRGTGIRMVNMGELFSYARIKEVEMERVQLSDKEESNFLLNSGDLLFARQSLLLSGVGKCSIYLGSNEPVTFEGHIIRVRLDVDIADPLFYFYFFSSKHGRSLIEAYAEQVAAAGIRGSDLAKIPVPVPSLSEQRSVAKILSDLDSKIELNQQMNITLEAIGKAIFKHWFIDFEFPNEESRPYRSSGGEMVYDEELEKEIPKNWMVKPIDEVADFLNGLAMQKYPAENEIEFLPVIKIRELREGVTDSSDKASPNVPREYVVVDGDVLFSWSGSLEVVIWTSGRGALNQHLFKVTSKDCPKWFYYYWLLQHLPEYRRIAEGKATTMGHIQRHHLRSSLVLVPDRATLQRMDKILSSIVEKMIQLKESRNLAQIRDLLLPKLMSGRIRVPVEAR
jgi:type I restriction enzyme S subunit